MTNNESTKFCGTCGTTKAEADFNRDASRRDGLATRCRLCSRQYNRRYRDKNREMLDEYARVYREKNREVLAEKQRRRYAENPHVAKAQSALSHAIRDGRIARPNRCSRCAAECVPEGHHWSYAPEHRLDVIWLCKRCHRREHASAVDRVA